MRGEQFSPSIASGIGCHVCAAPKVDMIPGYERFHRVTSDCRPWPSGGRLCVCPACGCVQQMADQVWQSEIEQIYQNYSIYHQADGAEQSVFEPISGQASSRSAYLLERLSSHVQIPATGRLLDIGCGNGALLRAFNRIAPHWSLAGTELNDKYRSVVESIGGVKKLYTCEPDQVPGTFNFISMVHVLEHIPAPKDFLVRLWSKLEDGGILVVQVPDYLQNPFDLLIADHSTHFTAMTIPGLIESAGYNAVTLATNWVPKELTVVARKTKSPSIKWKASLFSGSDAVLGSLQWLQGVVKAARELSMLGHFGLFGTSIAATWLFGALETSVGFFVDEDPNRVGKTYLGRPVYHPSEVPHDSLVFIALPTKLAENIKSRMGQSGFRFNCGLPPSFPIGGGS
jgi:2-polyprenyl-3-methyl-5-hydroxy-6-metoxy-1,4-benzoquinol methylase